MKENNRRDKFRTASKPDEHKSRYSSTKSSSSASLRSHKTRGMSSRSHSSRAKTNDCCTATPRFHRCGISTGQICLMFYGIILTVSILCGSPYLDSLLSHCAVTIMASIAILDISIKAIIKRKYISMMSDNSGGYGCKTSCCSDRKYDKNRY